MSHSPSPSAAPEDMDWISITRPLICLDLETTGVHARTDRIVQIGLIKAYPDGRETAWKTLVNPTIPIPPEVTRDCHGISDRDVANAPPFRDLAPKLAKGFMNCDLTGFNVKFDRGFMIEEFRRCGIQLVAGLLDGEVVDSYRIFQAKEKRDLEAAVRFYLGEEMTDAHDAMADARYALRVLAAEVKRYSLPNTLAGISAAFEKAGDKYDGKIIVKNGVLCLNFGKWAGTPLKQIERSYLSWVLSKDFPASVKQAIMEILR